MSFKCLDQALSRELIEQCLHGEWNISIVPKYLYIYSKHKKLKIIISWSVFIYISIAFTTTLFINSTNAYWAIAF